MIRRVPDPPLTEILRAFLVLVAIVLGIVACLVTNGCAVRTNTTPDLACASNTYVLVIDPGFEPEERDAIARASRTWADATEGQLHLVVFVEAIGGDVEACTVQVMYAEPPHPDTQWGATMVRGHDVYGRPGGARSWISPRLRGRSDAAGALYATAMHELGHAFGLEHSGADDMGSCMWPFVSIGCEITPPTRARLCVVWGCTIEGGR